MLKELVKKIIKWLITTKSLPRIRRIAVSSAVYALSYRNGTPSYIYTSEMERAKIQAVIKKIKNENDMLLEESEAYQIYKLVLKAQKIKGDLAEVGVYKGGSAKIICEVKGNKKLRLFDTFEGLPELSNEDDLYQFNKGMFSAQIDSIKEYFKKYKGVYLYKGLFPATARTIKKNKFAFVHLDLDLYESTLNGLKFFYPRMSRGGIILSHDYITSSGVRKAFDEFFKNKREQIIELSGSQCLVVKI